MLGRFLEISLHTPDIQASLAFYESLGFVQATTGDTWTHPYAVVTDGHLYVGLHGRDCPPLTVTFVKPELALSVPKITALDIALTRANLDAESFNEISFADPHGLPIHVVEARTFSPPALDLLTESTCGYFAELGIPVRDYANGREFWEQLGFVGMDAEDEPFARVSLTSDHLNIGLYRSRALRYPVLTFESEDMRERIARLKEKKLHLSDEMPDALDAATNAVLIAPEGTRLLLLETPQ